MDLAEIYRSAVYRVHAPAGPIDLRVGAVAPALEAVVGESPWAFVTAWNPGSIPRGAGANRAAQASLARDVAAYRVVPAEGRSPDGAWREESLLVIGIDPGEALAIARRHGQAAILAGTGAGPARLLFTGG